MFCRTSSSSAFHSARQRRILQDHRHQPRAVVGREASSSAGSGRSGCPAPPPCGRARSARSGCPSARGRCRSSCEQEAAISTSGKARRDQAGGGGIFLQPVAKALIGKVDERHRALASAAAAITWPIAPASGSPRSGCGSSRAAAPHRPPSRRPRSAIMPGEIDAPGRRVEIAILGHRHAEVLDDRRMVRPGRIGQPDRRLRARPAGSAPAPAGSRPVPPGVATEAARSAKPSPRIIRTSAALIGRLAGQTGIGLGRLGLPQLSFPPP